MDGVQSTAPSRNPRTTGPINQESHSPRPPTGPNFVLSASRRPWVEHDHHEGDEGGVTRRERRAHHAEEELSSFDNHDPPLPAGGDERGEERRNVPHTHPRRRVREEERRGEEETRETLVPSGMGLSLLSFAASARTGDGMGETSPRTPPYPKAPSSDITLTGSAYAIHTYMSSP